MKYIKYYVSNNSKKSTCKIRVTSCKYTTSTRGVNVMEGQIRIIV